MRTVFVGAGDLGLHTAQQLLRRGHQVVLIEIDRERIDALAEEHDFGFLHGDGTKPTVLSEADPANTDILYCLTGSDQDNIIASLVGRSLGFERVITRVEDPEFEVICSELGLEDTIVPSRTIGRYLADTVEGIDVLELSSFVKAGARLFEFIAGPGDEGAIADLDLPSGARVICAYRDGAFHHADPSGRIVEGDEVVILTDASALPALRERWDPVQAEG